MGGIIIRLHKSGVVVVPRLTIGKYHTSEDDCIIPAEFTISFDNVDRDKFDGIFGKYRVLYVDYEANRLLVRVPAETKFIPAAATEIGKLIDYACLLEEGDMEICESGIPRPEDLVAGVRRPSKSPAKVLKLSSEVTEIIETPAPPQYEEDEEIRFTAENEEPESDESAGVWSDDEYEEPALDLIPDAEPEEPYPEFDGISPDVVAESAEPEEFPEENFEAEESREIFPDEDFPGIEDFEYELDLEEGDIRDLTEEPDIHEEVSGDETGEITISGEETPGFEISDEFADLEALGEIPCVEILLEEACGLFSEGKYEDAESVFRNVLEHEPGNDSAIKGLVNTLYESGQPEKACDLYNESVLLISPGPDLCLTAGRAFEGLGRVDEACECYRKALEADPDDIVVTERYAGLLINNSRYEDAVSLLDKSVLEKHGSAGIWIKRGDICILAEKTADALDSYEKALELAPGNMTAALSMLRLLKENERYGEAAELLDSYIELHPEDSHLWFEKGWVSEKSGNRDEALLDYDRAISLDGGCTKAVACKALLLMREKRPEEALGCYDLLIERRPDNPAVHHSRGLVLKVMNRYDEALESFEEATKLDPSDSDTLLESAELLLEIGRFEDALLNYNKLVEEGLFAPEVLTGQGDAYKALGKAEDAMEAYLKAIEAGGDISSALKGKAEILAALGRSDEAEEAFNAVLELTPSDIGVLSDLASLYENTDRPDQAISAYEKLLLVSPGDTSALHGMLKNLTALGRYSEALRVYDSLLVICPGETDLIAGKASSLAKLGRKEEAVVLYAAALEMNPGSAEYLLELVSLLSDIGRYEECLPYYDRLISIAPGEAGFVMSKALALFALKRYNEAVDGFEEVLLTRPNDLDALLNMGLALIRLGDRRGAMECYKRSIDIDPGFNEEWAKRGVDASSFIAWELERIQKVSETSAKKIPRPKARISKPKSEKEKTEATFHKTESFSYMDESPEKSGVEPEVKKPTKKQLSDPDYLYKKGLALTRKGYYRAALKCFKMVENLSEDHFEAVFSKGIIYAKNGYYDEAVECFDKVLGIEPSHEKAQKARKMAIMKKSNKP